MMLLNVERIIALNNSALNDIDWSILFHSFEFLLLNLVVCWVRSSSCKEICTTRAVYNGQILQKYLNLKCVEFGYCKMIVYKTVAVCEWRKNV